MTDIQHNVEKMVNEYLDIINKSIAIEDRFTSNNINAELQFFAKCNTFDMYVVSIFDEDGQPGQLIGYFDEGHMTLLLLEFDTIFNIIWKAKV